MRISDLGVVITGKTPTTKKKENWDGSIPFITPGDLQGSKHIIETSRYITDEGLSAVKGAVLPKGAICVSCIGVIGYVGMTTSTCVSNQQINSIVVSSEHNSDYVYYLMCALWPFFKNYEGQSTTLSILNKTQFSKIEIPDKTRDEEDRIARVLNAIDEKIEKNSDIVKNMEEQLDAVYRHFYPYQLTDDLPNGWKYIPLGSLCDSISNKHSFNKEELIFLNTGDIQNGRFLHNTYSFVKDMPGQAKKAIKTNDILYSEIRPINRHYAFVTFPADDYVVSTKLMVIRSCGIEPRRLYHYLTTKDVIAELQLEAESRSGTFPQIRFENIQRIPMIIAPSETEQSFIGILKNHYQMVDRITLENQKLSELRDALLPRLISGELDTSDVVL